MIEHEGLSSGAGVKPETVVPTGREIKISFVKYFREDDKGKAEFRATVNGETCARRLVGLTEPKSNLTESKSEIRYRPSTFNGDIELRGHLNSTR